MPDDRPRTEYQFLRNISKRLSIREKTEKKEEIAFFAPRNDIQKATNSERDELSQHRIRIKPHGWFIYLIFV